MVFDADVHISPRMETSFSFSAEKLIDTMDKCGVDKSLVWLQPPMMVEVSDSNEYIYKSALKYPDRIYGFGWANPHLGIEKSKDEIKRCIYEYGFYGVKLNGAQNNYYIDDPVMALPLIEEIAKTGKILAFHVGADFFEQTHPFRVGKIAKMYPELQIIMIHMGGAAIPDLSNAAIEITAEHPNITVIGSGVSPRPIFKAIKTLGAKRVCFGTDSPFQYMHVELAKYNALLSDESFTDEERDDIMGKNIARLLGVL
jgi:predicted TIM-barrel fold metal-dependent hydrolase